MNKAIFILMGLVALCLVGVIVIGVFQYRQNAAENEEIRIIQTKRIGATFGEITSELEIALEEKNQLEKMIRKKNTTVDSLENRLVQIKTDCNEDVDSLQFIADSLTALLDNFTRSELEERYNKE